MTTLCRDPGCREAALDNQIARTLGRPALGRCTHHALAAINRAEGRHWEPRPTSSKRAATEDAWEKRERENDEAVAEGATAAVPFDKALCDLVRLMVLNDNCDRQLLDPVDLRIVRIAAELGGVKYRAIARRLGVTAPAVLKRVRRLSAQRAADAIEPLPRQPLTDPLLWQALMQVMKALHGNDLEEFRDAVELYRRIARARQVKHVAWQSDGDRIPQPRCHSCGRFLHRPPTGRPPKYCSERCRSSYRRKKKEGGEK